MNCHWCGKEYQKSIYYDHVQRKVIRNHYACPDDHGEYHLDQNGRITSYSFLFFSDDEFGSLRYKIVRQTLISGTPVTLFIRNLNKVGGYKHILDIPDGPPMEVIDGIPQVRRMFERLKKLAIFT